MTKSWNYVEQFKILLLNRANRVLGIYEASTGGVSGTVADPKLIFAAAIKGAASSIILSHNHPSGNLNPSEADLKLTRKLVEGGKFPCWTILSLPVKVIIPLLMKGCYSPFHFSPLVAVPG